MILFLFTLFYAVHIQHHKYKSSNYGRDQICKLKSSFDLTREQKIKNKYSWCFNHPQAHISFTQNWFQPKYFGSTCLIVQSSLLHVFELHLETIEIRIRWKLWITSKIIFFHMKKYNTDQNGNKHDVSNNEWCWKIDYHKFVMQKNCSHMNKTYSCQNVFKNWEFLKCVKFLFKNPSIL